MVITVVQFRAFDRPCQEAFIDKEMWEIHKVLATTCNSYVPQSISNITNENGVYTESPIDIKMLVRLQEEAAKQVAHKMKGE